MANVMLPRLVPEKSNPVKNFLVRQGANLPPRASRRRYSVAVSDCDPKVLPDIAVFSAAAKKISVEFVKFDSDSGRNSSAQSYQDGLYNESLGKNSSELLSVSGLRINGYGTQKIHSDDDDWDKKSESIHNKSPKDLQKDVANSGSHDWNEDDDDDDDELAIDPTTVQWDHFEDKKLLNENLDLFLSCKKVNMTFDIAKPDYIQGFVVVPVFHCPKCLECWNSTRKLPESCVEEAQPTRGKPMALDESANSEFQNQENVNFITIRERRKKRGGNFKRQRLKRRQNIVNVPFGFDVVPSECDSNGNIVENKESNQGDLKGMRKYGGLNRSEAEIFVRMSDSARLSQERFKRSNFSDSGKGSFESLYTTSSTGFQKKPGKEKELGMLEKKLANVVSSAIQQKKNDSLTRQRNSIEQNGLLAGTHGSRKNNFTKSENTIGSRTGQTLDSGNSKRQGLKSIDESNVLSDIGKDISAASSLGFSNRSSFNPNASPSDVLSKIKHGRKTSSSFKSVSSFQKNQVGTEKHMIATPGGGGLQQIVDPNRVNNDMNGQLGGSNPRKSSIPVNFDEQYLMKGNKEAVVNRRLSSATNPSRAKINELTNNISQINNNARRSHTKKYRDSSSTKVYSKSASSRMINGSENKSRSSKLSDTNKLAGKSSVTEKDFNSSRHYNTKKNDSEFSSNERKIKGFSSGIESRDQLSSPCSSLASRPSSTSHLNCLDSLDELRYGARIKSPSKKSKGKKMTAKERLYASLEVSRRKQSMQTNYDLLKKSTLPVSQKIEKSREELTPSPKLSSRISKNEMICMRMRQLTQSFTFSFFDLPVQYKENNENIRRVMNAGAALQSSRRKKGKHK